MSAPTPRALFSQPNTDQRAADHAAKAERESVARQQLPKLLAGSEFAEADVALLAMPGFPITLSPQAPERRERFRAHIAALVEESSVPCEAYDDESRVPPAVTLANVCGVCKGLCCRHAGNQAHIDDAALRLVRALRPELSAADVVAAYVNAIPERSVEHSCIVHGEHGCALPRELRSQTCNEFYCAPVREWEESEARRSDARPTAMVVVHGAQLIRASLLRR
ncbi:MAG TPA: hypothetical protein VGC79_35145 [Polyangiaceae bacterium]